MLDDRMRMMLTAANTLTAEDLDTLRGVKPVMRVVREETVAEKPKDEPAPVSGDGDVSRRVAGRRKGHAVNRTSPSTLSRGKYERLRTRESKVSTACMGQEREKHSWWPVGTRLVGQIDSERFMGTVVENPQVKSGRSILITSGPAAGKLCITPTRAAIEATEAFRQARNLGRGGGVTNGWSFWRPVKDGA